MYGRSRAASDAGRSMDNIEWYGDKSEWLCGSHPDAMLVEVV